MTTDERLNELARAVLNYDEVITEVARRRGITGTAAWSVDGELGDRLDALYLDLITKARAAVTQ